MSFLNKIQNFLRESRLEVRKVNWPSRQKTIKYTLIVLVASGIVAAFLGGLDLIFSSALNKLI